MNTDITYVYVNRQIQINRYKLRYIDRLTDIDKQINVDRDRFRYIHINKNRERERVK